MILCWLFLVFDAYMGHMSCFWLPNTFKHLPNLGKCCTVNSQLFKIKKLDISFTQPSLQLEHKQVSWHQLSVTPSGNISSEVRNNLCAGHPFYWREWFQSLSAVSRSSDGKTRSLQVDSALAAGAVEAKLSCRQPCKLKYLVQWQQCHVSPLRNSMVWLRSVGGMLVLILLPYPGIILNP